jgi:cation:H+ antiporter
VRTIYQAIGCRGYLCKSYIYPVLGFTICAIIIFFAGKKLSYYGDQIAGLTGMGRAWIGIILMASVTSLPELAVGISSSAMIKSADLAVGNIFGSCAFNLCLIALLDVFVPKGKFIFSSASQSHVLATAIGILLLGVAGAGLLLPNDIYVLPWLGLSSLSFFAIYLGSVRLMYNYELKNRGQAEGEHSTIPAGMTLGKAAGMYTFYAAITVSAAIFLPQFAEEIATKTGMGESFAGTLLLAISTSLPEIAVSITAIRMGALDMSVGNLVGSNIFNVVILAVNDMFYTGGHLLKEASDIHLVSVLATIMMSAIAIIGLTYRPTGRKYLMGWDALAILVVYIFNLVLIYKR